MTRRDGLGGFTLVELVVVIGIGAVILGLLAAALSRVRRTAQTVHCASNLRQMALAAQQYALDFQHFPPAVRYEMDGVMRTLSWDWVTTGMGLNSELISPGALWSYTDDPAHVQQCPAYHGPSNAGADPFTGYNYNTTYLGGESQWADFGWDAWAPGLTFAQCKRGERCAMFGDGGYRNGANKFMRAPLDGSDLTIVYSGGQAFRHDASTNVAYIDGHVDAVDTPHEGERATPDLLENYLGFPRNGFLSDDDSAYDPR